MSYSSGLLRKVNVAEKMFYSFNIFSFFLEPSLTSPSILNSLAVSFPCQYKLEYLQEKWELSNLTHRTHKKKGMSNNQELDQNR